MIELSENILRATFSGMGRTNDQLVYFDKQNNDVLTYVEGYFSSLFRDQSTSNWSLANRISLGLPADDVDKRRHILIDQLLLSNFLQEYINQSNGKEPFNSFPELFSTEVLKDFAYNSEITMNNLTFSHHIQQKFHKIFSDNYHLRAQELGDDYTSIFEKTCNSLAFSWIKEKVFI